MAKNKDKKSKAPMVAKTISTVEDMVFELKFPNYRETTVFTSKDGKHVVESTWRISGPAIKFDGKWVHNTVQLQKKLAGITWELPQ